VTTSLNILYEDNHLIAVNKMPSEIVQGDKTGDEPMSDRIKEYLRVKYEKPGEAFLGTIHRIDRPVSGVVLFAKTSKALRRMNEQFRERQVSKTYFAVVKNKPEPPADKLINWISKNEKNNKATAFDKEVTGSSKAELNYELMTSSDQYHLLKVTPISGRHHQIRVQLSKIGCPIKGDLKYGARRSNKDASIHLHAYKIKFMHPVNKHEKIITAPLPTDPLWSHFKSTIEES
jgi:23S rRNA pseudouridine1911/1915/1917 synthase